MPGATIDLPTLVQRIRVDTSDMAAAEKRAAATSKALRGAQDDAADSSADLETQSGRTAKSLDELGDASQRTTGEVDDLGRSSSRTADEVARLSDTVRRTRRESEDAGVSYRRAARDVDELGHAARRARGGMRGLRLLLRPALYYGLSGFIAPAVTAISALGGAGLAAAGGIAPAAGALAGLPALLGAVVSGSKAFTTATSGTLDAAKAIAEFGANSTEAKEALKELTPEAKKYAEALVPFVEESEKAGDSVRKMALPGLTRGLQAAFPVMRIFSAAAADVGKEVGRTGEELGKFVGSKGFLDDLRILAGANTTILGNLGKSVVPLVSAFRNVAVAATPMSIELSKATRQFAEFLDATTTRNRGKLGEFFDRAGRAAIRLSKAIGSTSAAIGRIASIGAQVFGGSDGITAAMERGAKRFSEWTKSAEGRNSIRRYFEDIKPVAKELGLLTRDLLKAFATLARDPNTASMISQIRTELLPALVTLLQKSAELAPSIINILTRLAEIIAEIDPVTLELLAGALSATASALALIAKYVPGFSEFVTLALTYAAIRRFPGLGSILPSLGTIARGGTGGRTGGGTTGGGTTVVGGTTSSRKAPSGSRTSRTASRVGGGAGALGAAAAVMIVPQLAIGPAESAFGRAESGALTAQEIIAAYNESAKTQADREKAADALRKSATEIESSSKGFGGNLLYGINDAIAKVTGNPTATSQRNQAVSALRDEADRIDGGRGRTPAEFRTSPQSPLDRKVLPTASEVFGTKVLPTAQEALGGILGKQVIPDAQSVLSRLRQTIATNVGQIRTSISGSGGIASAFQAALATIPGLGAVTTSGLGAKITAGLATVRGQVTTGGGGVVSALRTALGLIPPLGSITTSGLATRLGTGLAVAAGRAGAGATGIVTRVRTFLSQMPGIGTVTTAGLTARLGAGLAAAAGRAASGAQGITARVRSALAPIPGIALSAVTRAASAFGGLVSRAVRALGSGSALYAAGARLVGQLAAGIRSAVGAVRSAIGYVGSVIARFVPGSPVKEGPLRKFNGGGVGLTLARMLSEGLISGGSQVSAAAHQMVAGISNPSVSATVAARNAIATAQPQLGPVPAPGRQTTVNGPVDRSIHFQFGDIISGRDEPASDALTRKLTELQAAGVFG